MPYLRRLPKCLGCIPVLLTLLTIPGIVRAESQDFRFIKQSLAVDPSARTATFSLTFSQPPSFVAVDGSQIEAFQYEIDTGSEDISKPIPPSSLDAIVRGAEIFETGNTIPIRNPSGDGGPNAGGWGPVKATVPFTLNDNTLTFTANWSDIGDSDGKFRYRVFTTDTGAITADTQGTTAAIPLPAGVWTGAILLLLAFSAVLFLSHRERVG